MIHFIGGPLHGDIHELSRWNPLPFAICARMPREFNVRDLLMDKDEPIRYEPIPIIQYDLHEIWRYDRLPVGILATTLDVDRAMRVFNGDELWRPPRKISVSVRSQIILSGSASCES